MKRLPLIIACSVALAISTLYLTETDDHKSQYEIEVLLKQPRVDNNKVHALQRKQLYRRFHLTFLERE